MGFRASFLHKIGTSLKSFSQTARNSFGKTLFFIVQQTHMQNPQSLFPRSQNVATENVGSHQWKGLKDSSTEFHLGLNLPIAFLLEDTLGRLSTLNPTGVGFFYVGSIMCDLMPCQAKGSQVE